jgi:hypothetical protein
MPNLTKLILVFEELRQLVSSPNNDFSWSSWNDQHDAIEEIDTILSALRSGEPPKPSSLEVLFAPTGPAQELSLSSGWSSEFLALAEKFDEAIATVQTNTGSQKTCSCLVNVPTDLKILRELGLDDHHAEVSILVCQNCGRQWLKYFYEVEAFARSGRWYLGTLSVNQSSIVTLENAKHVLEELDWFYYGGSYFDGRSGKTHGEIPSS